MTPIIQIDWVNRFHYDKLRIFNYDGTSYDKYYELINQLWDMLHE